MNPLKPKNPDSITSGVRSRYLDQQPPEEFLGTRGCLRYHGVGSHTMCGYYYPAQNAKGVVILVHGQVGPLAALHVKQLLCKQCNCQDSSHRPA